MTRRTLKSLRAAEAQCEDLEVPLDVVDMEESAAAEAEAMMEAQGQAAALNDTLQGDMHTCGRCPGNRSRSQHGTGNIR